MRFRQNKHNLGLVTHIFPHWPNLGPDKTNFFFIKTDMGANKGFNKPDFLANELRFGRTPNTNIFRDQLSVGYTQRKI